MNNKQRPLLLLMLVVYIFSPTLFSWVVNPDGAWYRPYLIWVLVIIVAFFVQTRSKRNDV
ncbi:hypothetical protein [Saccharophagus degradans]|uniref:MFS transporter n=1 Tax=Saccharophagus degradans TaxID=86304 RepID=A0AAW7XCT9_9GAMM|nr:hypothetical protein [Saccharophagus degradans]MBU2986333.1 hypothetical protein [Saccharophagus degradans]MDO6424376.1 hypothetical protein [Saccharophagus degradans]MDO6608417.1 hypothetical protein [Saccharophagus degradans]